MSGAPDSASSPGPLYDALHAELAALREQRDLLERRCDELAIELNAAVQECLDFRAALGALREAVGGAEAPSRSEPTPLRLAQGLVEDCAAARVRADAALAAASAAEAALAAVHGSTSWRVTAPLRRLRGQR